MRCKYELRSFVTKNGTTRNQWVEAASKAKGTVKKICDKEIYCESSYDDGCCGTGLNIFYRCPLNHQFNPLGFPYEQSSMEDFINDALAKEE